MNLLIVGNDKLGRRLLTMIRERHDLAIVRDASTDINRVLKLIRRGSLRLSWFLKMAGAELMRENQPAAPVPEIRGIPDVLDLIRRRHVQKIYLFRAGLIINRKILDTGVVVYNVHCASLPEYKGIGSVARALADRAFNQKATLYRVTEKIDEGDILATQPYRLVEGLSYRRNEDTAYEAGMKLLLKELNV